MNRDVCEHFNPVNLPCGKCKPEALRLADALIEDAADHLDVSHAWDMRPEVTINHRHYMNAIHAVVELRRLHAESQALTDALFQAQEAAKSLLAQRDALLEALKTVEWHGQGSCWVVDADKIDAAIAKAEENT